MQLAFAVVLAVLPALLLVWYFYAHDRRPEPHRVLITTFLLGVAAVLPMLGWGLLLERWHTPLTNPFAEAVLLGLLIVVPEELLKFAVLMGYSVRHAAYDEPMDAVVYGAVAALGLACLENVLFVLHGDWTTALLRGLTTVPFHAALGAILGFYVGQEHFVAGKGRYVLRGLLLVMLIHLVYDVPLLVLREVALRRGTEAEVTLPWPLKLALPLASLVMLIVALNSTYRIVRFLRLKQKPAVMDRENS
ncbi:MAG: PrsW family intramembrane metalloprotease [Planctomycetia bacterium]|nr:PrsW family intramembrane metalloprotease [Planctomycetia bacterium]